MAAFVAEQKSANHSGKLLRFVQGSSHPSGELDGRSLAIARARLVAATEPVRRSASALPNAAHPTEGEVTSPGHRRPGARFPHPAEQQPDVRGVAHTDLLKLDSIPSLEVDAWSCARAVVSVFAGRPTIGALS